MVSQHSVINSMMINWDEERQDLPPLGFVQSDPSLLLLLILFFLFHSKVGWFDHKTYSSLLIFHALRKTQQSAYPIVLLLFTSNKNVVFCKFIIIWPNVSFWKRAQPSVFRSSFLDCLIYCWIRWLRLETENFTFVVVRFWD